MDTKWDQRFIDLARLIATWSKDPSTKVGAVIVDANKRIVSVGYNGVPRGVAESDTRERKLYRTIHAEQNAMAFANRDLAGCRIYVTHAPCAQCAAMMAQRGLAAVYYQADNNNDYLTRWESSISEGKQMLSEAGVMIVQVHED